MAIAFRQLSDFDAYGYVNNTFGEERVLQQDCTELLWLFEHVRKHLTDINIVLEIGSLFGGNLCMLSRLVNEQGLIISVEPELERKGSLDVELISSIISPIELQPFTCLSSEAIHTIKKLLDGRLIDLLFIDGDHSYKGAKFDFDTYSPLVASPGIIVVHDLMRTKTVGRVWKDVTVQFPHTLSYLFNIGTGICFL